MTPELTVPRAYESGVHFVKTSGIYFAWACSSLPLYRA